MTDVSWKKVAMSIVFPRERGRCWWCQRPVVRMSRRYGPFPANMATLDHIVPRGKGGRDHSDNLVLACYACNHERGPMAADAFLALKQRQARAVLA